MILTDGEGTPLGIDVESASPHEVTLIERLLTKTQLRLRKRFRLLYDKAADSDPLRDRLRDEGILLISPYRQYKNRPVKKLSKPRAKHYRNRWKVERTIGWLKDFRRLGMRWEYHAHLFAGFWQLGCLFSILRGL
jgi:transposase